jgi:hypothetical protein
MNRRFENERDLALRNCEARTVPGRAGFRGPLTAASGDVCSESVSKIGFAMFPARAIPLAKKKAKRG